MDADTKIIDEVFLPDLNRLTSAGKLDGIAFPFEMRRMDDLISRIGMAFQAGAGD